MLIDYRSLASVRYLQRHWSFIGLVCINRLKVRLQAVSYFSLQSYILYAKPKHASRDKRGRKPEKKK